MWIDLIFFWKLEIDYLILKKIRKFDNVLFSCFRILEKNECFFSNYYVY